MINNWCYYLKTVIMLTTKGRILNKLIFRGLLSDVYGLVKDWFTGSASLNVQNLP